MSAQRYERVPVNDNDDGSVTPTRQSGHNAQSAPNSPPPSFRSRASSITSRHALTTEDPLATDAERTLNDAFDDGSESEGESNDRQRLMRSTTIRSNAERQTGDNNENPDTITMATQIPAVAPPAARYGATPFAQFSHSNDGVFANLNAKPERGEKTEEQPPSYEIAAADATPPYWETTILAPNSLSATDEVYVDGLPVGSLFSFVWNAMISMSFSLVGFLLTYLLHTTHAAKNGSRAGLGVTLVQYGFYLHSTPPKAAPGPADGGDAPFAAPEDPNSHDFDPSSVSDLVAAGGAAIQSGSEAAAASGSSGSLSASSNALAYTLMVIGWFILIRAVSDFFKARQHEQLVLRSPDRGLNVPVVADNERPEGAV